MLGSVYVDFDGTIAPSDPTDTMFERFCHSSWRQIEREWQQGRRSARACMAAEVALLRATPEALAAALRDIKIDPQFPEFVELCRNWDLEIIVLSDGLDRVVSSVLRSAGLDLPIFANRLQWSGADRWQLEFPFARQDCAAALGNCKCGHRSTRAHRSLDIVVGDGRSDFCIAERSQLVLAKGQLAAHCRFRRIPHQPIENFAAATACLRTWLAKCARKSA
jgi:2-hydroxy-3-keto-5-methylthiopentenyl-1-phosphate phosphatase